MDFWNLNFYKLWSLKNVNFQQFELWKIQKTHNFLNFGTFWILGVFARKKLKGKKWQCVLSPPLVIYRECNQPTATPASSQPIAHGTHCHRMDTPPRPDNVGSRQGENIQWKPNYGTINMWKLCLEVSKNSQKIQYVKEMVFRRHVKF